MTAMRLRSLKDVLVAIVVESRNGELERVFGRTLFLKF